MDSNSRKTQFRFLERDSQQDANNGSTVSIEVLDSDVRFPQFEALAHQLQNHFALRDMLTDPSLKLTLQFQNARQIQTRLIQYEAPIGELKVNEKIFIDGFGEASLEIYESPTKLQFAQYDPCSEAGLIIRTDGAVLDNRLFSFEMSPPLISSSELSPVQE